MNAGTRDCAAMLVPVTPEALASLGNRSAVRITQFPFRIGREMRATNSTDRDIAAVQTNSERRNGSWPSNDLYLVEPPWITTSYISRQHCTLEAANGLFFVADNGGGSPTTLLAARAEDGHISLTTTKAGLGGRFELRDNETSLLVLGTTESPYAFRFEAIRPS
jgi:hypothetical protein